MRIRVERGEGKTWFLSISGGSNRPVTRRSLIRQTIVMIVLDILIVILTATALVREIRAGDSPLLILMTLLPLAAIGPGQFVGWRGTYQALRQQDENELE